MLINLVYYMYLNSIWSILINLVYLMYLTSIWSILIFEKHLLLSKMNAQKMASQSLLWRIELKAIKKWLLCK